MVEANAAAPAFTLPDDQGHPVSLADFAGQKLLVYFYPKDDTPGCTKQACSLRDHNARLQELGVAVVGVSADGASSHQRFSQKYQLNFSLLSDEGWQTAKAYGAYGPKQLYGREYEGVLRQTYLIDERGRVEKVWKRVKTATHGADVLAYLEGRD